MRTFFIKYWYWLLAIVIAWIVGFFMGRAQSDVIKEVKYIKGKDVHDTIPASEPEHSQIPDNPVLPMRRDTIFKKGKDSLINVPYYVTEKVDTGAIITQYITENKYSSVLFDNNEHGKLRVNSSVQYNKLQGLGYDFTPITKEVTKERKRIFTPFLTGSYSSLKTAGVGAGIYVKSVGIGAKLITDTKTGQTGYEGGIYIKF